MTLKEVMKELEGMGNASVRAHNTKFGAKGAQFGVKMGDIRALAKRIGADHGLGMALWKTGNLDAQFLAALVMEVKKLSAEELDGLVRSTTFAHVANWLDSYVVSEHPEKEALREKWMREKDRWAARAGWSLTAERVAEGAEGLDVVGLLDRIEREMGKAPEETQWTMNTTLAQIGIHFAEHRKRAIGIGEMLGVYRDYPTSKGCTSPFAPIWIEAMVKRQKGKSAK
jgi:3-methyladenine DNA glycosylase AlkD